METKPMIGWWNYKTERIEYRDSPVETDEEALQYIPQAAAAQSLYLLHRHMGIDVPHAMIKVLESCISPKHRARKDEP